MTGSKWYKALANFADELNAAANTGQVEAVHRMTLR